MTQLYVKLSIGPLKVTFFDNDQWTLIWLVTCTWRHEHPITKAYDFTIKTAKCNFIIKIAKFINSLTNETQHIFSNLKFPFYFFI